MLFGVEKRSEGVRKAWENISEEDKNSRINKGIQTKLEKAGYTREMILEIKELHKNGMKPRFILEKYPNLTKQDVLNITDKRKWNNIIWLK